MRRAQSVRHYARPSLALAADDLGVLREGDETNEDVLRRQLLDKDRECDKLQMTIQALQDQLAQRPPLEKVQALEREYKDLELLLQGTQRENEKCMADMERAKAREKMLERELTRLAGDNWQANLEIPPSTNPIRGGVGMLHQRSNTISAPMTALGLSRHTHSPSPSPRLDMYRGSSPGPAPRPSHSPLPFQGEEAAKVYEEERERGRLAQLEQLKLLVLGMQQRLEVREEKLVKTVERAENEGRRFEAAAASLRTQAA